MSRRKPDHFYHRAKDSGYAARSVFKLEEIQKKYRLFKRGMHVLDLGASPGSWLQFISNVVGENGQVTGVDLSPLSIELSPNVSFHALDVFSDDVVEVSKSLGPFDVVVSDMAPKTSGIADRDHELSLRLCDRALDIARISLKPGGSFLCKYFQGSSDRELEQKICNSFLELKRVKPEASRKRSRESFLLGLKKKN